METKKWARWQDWVALVAGVVMALTPIWFNPNETGGLWAMIVLGVVLAGSALWSLMAPGAIASEWLHAALGVLMIVAPWVMRYVDEMGASWSSWVLGVVAVIVGLWAVPESTQAHKKHLAAG
jgi:hypothetical protein